VSFAVAPKCGVQLTWEAFNACDYSFTAPVCIVAKWQHVIVLVVRLVFIFLLWRIYFVGLWVDIHMDQGGGLSWLAESRLG